MFLWIIPTIMAEVLAIFTVKSWFFYLWHKSQMCLHFHHFYALSQCNSFFSMFLRNPNHWTCQLSTFFRISVKEAIRKCFVRGSDKLDFRNKSAWVPVLEPFSEKISEDYGLEIALICSLLLREKEEGSNRFPALHWYRYILTKELNF